MFSEKKHVWVGILLFVVIVAWGIYVLVSRSAADDTTSLVPKEVVVVDPVLEPLTTEVIGTSVEGRDIQAYTFRSASSTEKEDDRVTHLLMVGGIHGGYEWNSVLLAYKFIDHFSADSRRVPEGVKITVIPNANPDGVFDVIGAEGRFGLEDVPDDEGPLGNGRFNANGIDLNRNFDCKWKEESSWRGETVSAGTAAFSEPEAVAIRDFVGSTGVDAAVFLHSQSNAVYASECEEGVLPETLVIMNTYADAAEYPAVESFDFYEISGDAEGWLASVGIPAITVELSTHETLEWEKNLKGFEALLERYRQ